MRLLGSFDVDEDIIVSVAWTPVNPQETVDASKVTIRHATSTDVIGPLSGALTSPNTFEVTIQLPRTGRWIVQWVTDPEGGVDRSMLYVQ